jgi:hypothetical protein
MQRVAKKLCRAGTAVALAVAAAAVPGVAQAARPIVNFHGEVPASRTFNDCGFTIQLEKVTKEHVMIREVEGSNGQAFLGHVNSKSREVLTNPATGAWFVILRHSLYREFTGRQIQGNIWEFTAHEAGQPFTVEDSDGNVVQRNRGRVTYRIVFDTQGDTEPGGIELVREVTSVSGPHLSEDVCAIARDLIG